MRNTSHTTKKGELSLKLFLLLLALSASSLCSGSNAFSPKELVKEVITHAENPHAYDYRSAKRIFSIGHLNSQQGTIFKDGDDDFMASVMWPLKGSQLVRSGLRRITVEPTYSSEILGQTPFTQPASVNRYEVFVHYMYTLLEGRMITRLTTTNDLEAIFAVGAGMHYSHQNKSWLPKKDHKSEPLPGQDPYHSPYGVELTAIWQLYLPQKWGVFAELSRIYPTSRKKTGLPTWQYITAGVTWSM